MSILPQLYVGTQSWFYPEWKGVFYDEFAASDEFLAMYAQEFSFVEVDTSFYAPPKPQTLAQWLAATPPDFRFALKVPREITHERCFAQIERPLQTFLERVAVLKEKLGPLLFQLPPQMDVSFAKPLWSALGKVPPFMRCAVEFRHPSWFVPETFAQLDVAGAVAAAVDGPFMPEAYAKRIIERNRAAFCYVRLLAVRGSVERFDRRVFDRAADLRSWAMLLRQSSVKSIFLTSSNYYEGFAPETCRRFSACYGLPTNNRVIRRQMNLFD